MGTVTIYGRFETYVFADRWGYGFERVAGYERAPMIFAEKILEDCLVRRGPGYSELMALGADLCGWHTEIPRDVERRVLEELLSRMDRPHSRFVLFKQPRPTLPLPPPLPKEEMEDAESAVEESWIEFVLVDANDVPIEDEPYEVTLPDGSTRSGNLSVRGKLRLENILHGSCRVTFPELGRSWDVMSQSQGGV